MKYTLEFLFTEHYTFVFFCLLTLWLTFYRVLAFFPHLNSKTLENWATSANCVFVLLVLVFCYLFIYWNVDNFSTLALVLYFLVAALLYEDLLGANQKSLTGDKKSYLVAYWWLTYLPLFITAGLYVYRLIYLNRYSFKYLYLTHLSLLLTLVDFIVLSGISLITFVNLLSTYRKARKTLYPPT